MSQIRHFNYSVPIWCQQLFGAKFDIPGLIKLAKDIGVGLDLSSPGDWPVLREAGLRPTCVLPDMGKDDEGKPIAPFAVGFNDPRHHARVRSALNKALDQAHEHGIPFVLVFTGNDTGEDRSVQFGRIVEAFTNREAGGGESLIEKAKRLGVTFVIEMLNTVGDPATWKGHPGYLGNRTVELLEMVVQPIGSDNFKMALDIYHVKMMGEDPIEIAWACAGEIGLIHVAGVMRQKKGHHPQNRGEIVLSKQEVNYAEVMGELAKICDPGTFVLLEYIPTKTDPIEIQMDLQAAIALCESGIAA